jgi:hypothetical protein
MVLTVTAEVLVPLALVAVVAVLGKAKRARVNGSAQALSRIRFRQSRRDILAGRVRNGGLDVFLIIGGFRTGYRAGSIGEFNGRDRVRSEI